MKLPRPLHLHHWDVSLHSPGWPQIHKDVPAPAGIRGVSTSSLYFSLRGGRLCSCLQFRCTHAKAHIWRPTGNLRHLSLSSTLFKVGTESLALCCILQSGFSCLYLPSHCTSGTIDMATCLILCGFWGSEVTLTMPSFQPLPVCIFLHPRHISHYSHFLPIAFLHQTRQSYCAKPTPTSSSITHRLEALNITIPIYLTQAWLSSAQLCAPHHSTQHQEFCES